MNKDIPTLLGEKIRRNQIKVWCEYCCKYHVHGFPEGHRTAHCINSELPYNKTGYYIKVESEIIDDLKREQKVLDRYYCD